tara:strand:+ start:314 stop:484 length:171 start_codon:yes stop_codon:yes gene_type:complete
MKYKLLRTLEAVGTETEGKKIYEKIEDDGKSYSSCSEDNLAFKKWVEEGNTADPSD